MAEGRSDARKRRFWARYIKCLHEHGVRPPFDQWHVVRAEQFIKAFPDKRLAEIGSAEVADDLSRLGSDGRLKPWQFRQAIGAIRNLYNIVNTEWALQFDWSFWLDSARALEAQHATVAREAMPVSPEEFAERVGESRFAPRIRDHLELFAKAASVMRLRNMSWPGYAGSSTSTRGARRQSAVSLKWRHFLNDSSCRGM